jgi:hypothetical protein
MNAGGTTPSARRRWCLGWTPLRGVSLRPSGRTPPGSRKACQTSSDHLLSLVHHRITDRDDSAAGWVAAAWEATPRRGRAGSCFSVLEGVRLIVLRLALALVAGRRVAVRRLSRICELADGNRRCRGPRDRRLGTLIHSDNPGLVSRDRGWLEAFDQEIDAKGQLPKELRGCRDALHRRASPDDVHHDRDSRKADQRASEEPRHGQASRNESGLVHQVAQDQPVSNADNEAWPEYECPITDRDERLAGRDERAGIRARRWLPSKPAKPKEQLCTGTADMTTTAPHPTRACVPPTRTERRPPGGCAYQAKTVGELQQLVSDLPRDLQAGRVRGRRLGFLWMSPWIPLLSVIIGISALAGHHHAAPWVLIPLFLLARFLFRGHRPWHTRRYQSPYV